MDIPEALEAKLDAIEFYGDFSTLGIPISEALTMDNASLRRRINAALGIEAACEAEIAARTAENNRKFNEMVGNPNYTRIVI